MVNVAAAEMNRAYPGGLLAPYPLLEFPHPTLERCTVAAVPRRGPAVGLYLLANLSRQTRALSSRRIVPTFGIEPRRVQSSTRARGITQRERPGQCDFGRRHR